MKKNLIRRSSILAVLISLLMVTLTACGSEATVEEAKDSQIVIAEEAVVEETAAVEVAESEHVPAPETVPEPTVVETGEEATEEAPVYEGIDMESTLPGEEWIKTFDGIITVPKVVILNDETGRKQIVEDGDVITINPDTDYIAIYLPGGAQRANHSKAVRTVSSVSGEFYELLYLDVEKTRERGKQDAAVYVILDGEEVELPFVIIPE